MVPWEGSLKKRLALVAAVVVSGVSIWVSAGFRRNPPPPPAEAAGLTVSGQTITLAPKAPQWRSVRLDQAVPATAHWTDPVPARVKIDETRAARVDAPLAGRVTRVYVELGEPVHAGQPLFAVASPGLAELRAQREKAEVDFQAAQAALERVKAMVATHALPAKEELAAAQQLRQAEVERRLSGAKLASLKVASRTENEFTVTAPRDGVVVEKNVLDSQEVSPDGAAPLLVLADLSTVWVVADLFEADATDVHEGASAEITSPSAPELKLTGRVERVSAVIDPARHTVPIRVVLENAEHRLRPNAYAHVRFSVPARGDAVEIPASALVTDGVRQSVFVQEQPGRFVRRRIVAGSAMGGVVPVFDGLKAGDTIVAEGALLLDNQIALSE